MNLEDYRTVFVVSGLILSLVAAAPALSFYLPFSGGSERFSEFWLLGPGHMAEDYPFNVSADEDYLVYIGVCNHMRCSVQYSVRVKLRNQSEPLPNATSRTPSPVPLLYEYRVFLEDGNTWEAPLNFAFSGVSLVENRSLVEGLAINSCVFTVDKLALWDGENDGFYYQLFVELWIYEVESDRFEYHNRFVGIWLNMTSV